MESVNDGNDEKPMSKKERKQYLMSVECPHCATRFEALSPSDTAKPKAVYPDGGCHLGVWLLRFAKFTNVQCPTPECGIEIRLMWSYV